MWMIEEAAGIMGNPAQTIVDVRDMLCAQALARVSQAAGRLAPGGVLTVLYNAPDVRQDLVAWAASRRWHVEEILAGTLTVKP